MLEAILVMLSNPVEGREDDYNDWYTNVHGPDALRLRGSLAVQRFKYADDQVQTFPDGFLARYLALYEVYDAARFSKELVDNAFTTRLMMENSIALTGVDDFHYYPVQFRDKQPRSDHEGSVVLEQFAVLPDEQEQFQAWYNDTYLPERHRQDGIISSSLLAFDPHGQFQDFAPLHNYVGIHRLSDDRARGLWRESDALKQCPHTNPSMTAVTCWDILTPRLTEDDVFNPTPEALAAELATRARIDAAGTYMKASDFAQ